MPHLRSIDLSESDAGVGVAPLGDALLSGKLPRLSELNLQWSFLTEESVAGLTRAIKGEAMGELTDLNLSQNQDVESGAWRDFFEGLVASEGGLSKLSALHLWSTTAGEVLSLLGQAIVGGKLPHVTNLALNDCNLSDEGLRGLAEAVKAGALEEIEVLDLGENFDVQTEAWEELMEGILESPGGLPHLRILDCSATNVVDAGGAAMAVLTSGRLPSLWHPFRSFFADVDPFRFRLDEKGVGIVSDAIREGRFPPPMDLMGFRIRPDAYGISVDPILEAIAESEAGMPNCLAGVSLRVGRVGEEALSSLVASAPSEVHRPTPPSLSMTLQRGQRNSTVCTFLTSHNVKLMTQS